MYIHQPDHPEAAIEQLREQLGRIGEEPGSVFAAELIHEVVRSARGTVELTELEKAFTEVLGKLSVEATQGVVPLSQSVARSLLDIAERSAPADNVIPFPADRLQGEPLTRQSSPGMAASPSVV